MERMGVNHLCRSDQNCVARTPDGAAVTLKPDTLCGHCIKSLQEQYDQLPAITEALKVFLGGIKGTSHGSRVNSTPEPSVPINLHALDLIDEIGDAIDRVDGLRVADLVTQPGERFLIWRQGRPRNTYLDGVERALDIRKVWKKADNIIGMQKVWQRRAAPCPSCHLPSLGNFSGSDVVQCSSCGKAMSRSEYERICLGGK